MWYNMNRHTKGLILNMRFKNEKNQNIMLSHISYFEVEPMILRRDSNGEVIYPNMKQPTKR